MDIIINKGIVKKSIEGNSCLYVLKDFNSGVEFSLSVTTMLTHKLKEGDLVEFAGSVYKGCTYLAISGIDYQMNLN